MAKEFAKAFYQGQAWKDCREVYRKSKSGLCERCLAKGLIVPGVVVHHKKYLTPENINDPSVTLNFENLELVCRACHEEEHSSLSHKAKKRYNGDAFGRVEAWPE